MNTFLNKFKKNKPIIGMLHLGRCGTKEEALELTKREIDTYINNGIDGVLVENYFGDIEDVLLSLEYLKSLNSDIIYGINCLKRTESAFEFARKYKASFVQIDSVSGHLEPDVDLNYGKYINDMRFKGNVPVIGGVRFKYQPYKSGRTLKEDLLVGMERCDGIVVTGEGTGMETPLEKAIEFKKIIDTCPLIIGAGLTADNCTEFMKIADAAIVGSYFKDNYQDNGIVCEDHVRTLVRKIDELR